MIDLSMLQIVTLKNRRVHFGLIGGRPIMVFGGAKPVGSMTVERLDAVVHEPEGVTPDGRTLAVGSMGIILLVDHLATLATYANSPRRLHERLLQLFAGSAFAPEMIAATCRAAFGHPGVGGDTAYYIDAAKRQMQSWSTDTLDVEVQRGE